MFIFVVLVCMLWGDIGFMVWLKQYNRGALIVKVTCRIGDIGNGALSVKVTCRMRPTNRGA